MWIPNIEAWSQHYRTYAVDNIYDCGRSIYTRDLKSPGDFVQWLDEFFTSLELGNNINLVGLSYGSWLTHRYALNFPQRLRKIVLLAHPAIVPPRAEFVFRLLLSFLSPTRFKSFVYWLLQDTAQKDEASRMFVGGTFGDMQRAARCFKPKATVTPKTMTDHELQNLQVPALFLVGENEKTFIHQKAIQRLNAIAPQIKTEIIPKAGHDLNSAQAALVNKKVLAFLQ
jgi:pimeloyl-ACP methyl ester carboxylesterase